MENALTTPPLEDEISRRADQLQAAAEIAVLARRTRLSAILGLAFGGMLVLFALLGIASPDPGTAAAGSLIPLGIGALFMIEGAWTLKQLTPGVFLLSAFTSVLVGLWFVLPAFDGEGEPLFAILGAGLIFLGYLHVNRYLTLRRLWEQRPSDDGARAIAKRVERLQSGEGSDPEVSIEFAIEEGRLSWLGDLSEAVGVLLQPLTGRVACVSPRQLKILDEPGGSVTFLIRGQRFQGTINARSKAAYERWAGRFTVDAS